MQQYRKILRLNALVRQPYFNPSIYQMFQALKYYNPFTSPPTLY